jgi:transglutaminase-like putative cysteine protease
MNYEIRLTITNVYGAPSAHARTLVRLLPSDVPGQQVVRSRLLAADPVPSERREARDFFGNAMTALAFHAPIDRIELTLEATTERLASDVGLDLSPTLPTLAQEIAEYLDLGSAAPHHYLWPSVRVPTDAAISDFARDAVQPGMTTLQIVEALGQAIHSEMQFDTEATDVHTPPAEAFANRHGVCQDFSHIMIAGLRSLGIPAGYVSGFLRTIPPAGQPRLEGADAMHAWVSAWCGTEAGWIEYDPTNACLVGLDHIVIAYGRDYSDVAPVKGVLRTSGKQSSRHSVDVIPL